MADPAGPVALVDDDDDLRAALEQMLRLAGHRVSAFRNGEAALAAIDRGFPGVVVSDVRMPGMSGIELFRALRTRDAQLPVILLTGHGDVPMAVDALKAGAWDFLSKPCDGGELLAAVARGLTARALVMENRRLRALADGAQGDTLVGDSVAIRQLRAMIPALGDAELDMVIEGATGTGKTLFARAVHRAGRRGRHRLLPIDCATVPPALIEGEMFARGGIVARADRGTLLLENLDRADAALQHRLALLTERRAVALDRHDPDPVDLRIVATVDEGGRDRLLPALLHRLQGAPVRMPPLAERREDIPALVSHFARMTAEHQHCEVPPLAELAHALSNRDWPGNVRELAMRVERSVLGIEPSSAAAAPPLGLSARMDAFERDAIIEAVHRAGGEVGRAIEALGIPRKTFYYRVKRLDIDLRAIRAAADPS